MLYNTINIQCSLIQTNDGIKCCVSFLKSIKQFFDFFNIFDIKSISILNSDNNLIENKKDIEDIKDIEIENINKKLLKKEYKLFIYFNDGKDKCLAIFDDEVLANAALNDLQTIFFQVMQEKSLKNDIYKTLPIYHNYDNFNLNSNLINNNLNNQIYNIQNKKDYKKYFKYFFLFLGFIFILIIGYLIGTYRAIDLNKYNEAKIKNYENNISNNFLNNSQNNSSIKDELKNLKPYTTETFKELKNLSMIKFGEKEPDLYVFSDLNCGACKELDKILEKQNISYAIIPIATLGEESATKALKVICHKDKSKAWKEMLKNNDKYFDYSVEYTKDNLQHYQQCTQNLLDNINFFTSYNFTNSNLIAPATPTIISKNNKVNIGIPLNGIDTWLKNN